MVSVGAGCKQSFQGVEAPEDRDLGTQERKGVIFHLDLFGQPSGSAGEDVSVEFLYGHDL